MAETGVEFAWLFPKFKKPHCDVVTNEELQTNLISRWQADADGITRIPYTFASPSGWKKLGLVSSLTLGLHTVKDIFPKYQPMIKETLELSLKSWERASKGKIQFYETSLGPYSKGITVYLGDPQAMDAENLDGLTAIKLDNNGYMSQAAVIFPGSKQFWEMTRKKLADRSNDINTIIHELGHAIGLGHLHDDPSVLTKLRKMKHGAFCSVMTYASTINPKNKHADNEVFLTPTPADLDERSVAINYDHNHLPQVSDHHIHLNMNYAFINSAFITSVYQGIFELVKQLQNPKIKQPWLSEKQAEMVTDGIFLGVLFYLEVPAASKATFVINSLLKFMPHTWMDYLPFHLNRWLLDNKLTPAIVGTTIAARDGGSVLPFLETVLASELGSLLGTFFGKAAGRLEASILNKIIQCCAWFLNHHLQDDKALNLIQIPKDALINENNQEDLVPLRRTSISNERKQKLVMPSEKQDLFTSNRHQFFNRLPHPHHLIDQPMVAAAAKRKR